MQSSASCCSVLMLPSLQELLLQGTRALCWFGASLVLWRCSTPRRPESGQEDPISLCILKLDDAAACATVVGASLISVFCSAGLFCCSVRWGPPELRRDISYCDSFKSPLSPAAELEQQLQLRSTQLASLSQLEPRGNTSSSSSTRETLDEESLQDPGDPQSTQSHILSWVVRGLRRTASGLSLHRGPQARERASPPES